MPTKSSEDASKFGTPDNSPELPDVQIYRKRDAAFVTWLSSKSNDELARIGSLRSAFNAGWEGRKRAEIEAMLVGMRR